MKTAIVVINILVCITLIAVIAIQSGKTSGLSGALSGSSDSFLSKNKGKSFDARLARATKWIAGMFVVLTVILNIL